MPERIWLSAKEQVAWRAYVEATLLLFDTLERQLGRDAGMSHADYEILVHLSESVDHRMRMSELADRTLYSRSRLSHAVARLEKVGWVAREECATDRRGTIARLTTEGFAKLESTAPGHAVTVRRAVFDHLTRQQTAQLHAIAATIREHAPLAMSQDASEATVAGTARAGSRTG